MDTNQYQNPMSQSKSTMWIWIAIVAVAMVGVIYYFYFATRTPQVPSDQGISSSQSVADETASIEKDLKATDINGLGSELNSIQKELAK